MDEKQAIQHHEYDFPYHYLARKTSDSFTSYRNWNWSLQYMTALELVREQLENLSPRSHIDVGCGDGALLWNLQPLFPELLSSKASITTAMRSH